MTFDPRTYWPAMGPWLAGPGAVSPEHIRIEQLLTDLLPSLNPIHSVLDVGCGRGRLAALLKDVLPAAKYTGVDIGEAQTQATQAVRPDGAVYTVPIQDFDTKHTFDLILCSEVLMHIPPYEMPEVADRLIRMATKAIVLIEWTQPIGDVPAAEWNWIHDYRSLFPNITQETVHALQSIFIIRP